jgi:hypothetical protein
MEKEIYIALNDGRIGKIAKICNCIECQKRGSPEITLVDLDHSWLDSIAINKISKENLLYCGIYVTEAVNAYIEYLKDSEFNYNIFEGTVSYMLKELG